jgi:hypothetical protein
VDGDDDDDDDFGLPLLSFLSDGANSIIFLSPYKSAGSLPS